MGAPPDLAAPPPRSGRWLALAGFAAALGLFLFVGAKTTLVGVNSDAAIYLLRADHLAGNDGGDTALATHLFANYAFPPLYSLVLAVAGGGSTTPLRDYQIDAVLLAGAVIAAGLWARRAGLSDVTAIAAAATLALTPMAMTVAMGVFSEPLYLLLSGVGFALLAHERTGKPARYAWYAAGICLGLAATTRTVGLVGVLAVIASSWRRTSALTTSGVAACALAPSVLWSLYRSAHGWHHSYVDSVFAGGVAQAAHDLSSQLPINLRAFAYHGVRSFDLLGSGYAALGLGVLLLLALIGWARRLRLYAADALYCGLYLATILLWPFPNDLPRFLLVMLPFLLGYAGLGATTLLQSVGSGRLAAIGPSAVALVCAGITLPTTLVIVSQIWHARGTADADNTRLSAWYGYASQDEARHGVAYSVEVLRAIAAIAPAVPAAACVTATMAEMVMLHTRRRSVHPPGIHASAADLHATLAACPYVLLVRAQTFPTIDYPYYYPSQRVAPALRILLTVPAGAAQPVAILAHYQAPLPLP